MIREIYKKLQTWKDSPQRKPLILRGARQVGKAYILKYFGQQEYENIAYINFEQTPKVGDLFQIDLDPKRIIENLSIYLETPIYPAKTLLIFDEIQESAKALTSLKYFNEQANEYHIAAAGSLLGVKLTESKSFPVGKVNFLDLYPLTFFEFLGAIGKENLCTMLKNLNEIQPIPDLFHIELIDLLKRYFFVGGMPEAILQYSQSADFSKVREIQQAILDAYLLDFAKHVPGSQIIKITTVWEAIPSQLAKENKKFIFSAISKSARAREYESAIQWLADARLIHSSFRISVPKIPLNSYADKNIFKVFLLDVGLLSAMNKLPAKILIEGDQLFTEFKGALTENFIAQELVAKYGDELYYWASEGKPEIDLILQKGLNIYPLEVKAGNSKHKKSLKVYEERYKPSLLSRASLLNFKQDASFCNYPLYLDNKFPLTNE